jgi:hypothetical protein
MHLRRYLLFITPVLAHIQMTQPIPRGSPKGPWPEKDYDIMAPLGNDKTYPCQGKPKGPITDQWKAGQIITVDFEPKTMHSGGHCQWSVSYDNEKSFVTIFTMIQNCLHPSNLPPYKIPLPPSLPSCTSCVFQWTWINAIGAREIYSNCADVRIQSDRPVSQQVYTNNKVLVVHVPNGIGKVIPEFPNPGMYDGRELFTQQESITVNGQGNNSSGVNPAINTTPPAPLAPMKPPVFISTSSAPEVVVTAVVTDYSPVAVAVVSGICVLLIIIVIALSMK